MFYFLIQFECWRKYIGKFVLKKEDCWVEFINWRSFEDCNDKEIEKLLMQGIILDSGVIMVFW